MGAHRLVATTRINQTFQLRLPTRSNPDPLFTTKNHDSKNYRGFLAEKAGFEPALRYSRTTPLAGEPLQPLGYFSLTEIFCKY